MARNNSRQSGPPGGQSGGGQSGGGQSGQSGQYEWRRKIAAKMSNAYPVLQQSPNVPSLAEVDDTPFFDHLRTFIFHYRPDKNIPDEQYLLFGSLPEITQQIVRIEQLEALLKYRLEHYEDVVGNSVKRAGQPRIYLKFLEDREDVEPGFRQVEARISFRLMDVTDNPNDAQNRPLITWQFIEDLAKKIWEKFQKPSNKKGYVWRKGKESVSYNDWNKGYSLRFFSRDKNDGVELVKKILEVRGHLFEEKYASHSQNLDEAAAFPTVPKKIRVLGKERKQPRQRPIADVRFHKAYLRLALFGHPIELVNNGVVRNFNSDGDNENLRL